MPTIPAKYYLYLCAIIVILLGCWYLHYSIDKGGYDRRTAEYEIALKNRKDAAEKAITKLEKEYDALNKKVLQFKGENLNVGPRVEFAIDSVRSPKSDG